MFGDIFFVFRMLVVTTLVVIFLQVKIGKESLDDHFHDWIKTSFVVDYLQEAIDGGVALTKLGYQKVDANVHTMLAGIKRKHSGDRASLLGFKLQRFTQKDDADLELPRATSKSPSTLPSAKTQTQTDRAE